MSDEQEVKRVAQAYVDALVAKDAVAACEHTLRDGGCVEATEEEFSQGHGFGEDFGRVKKVRIEGNVARADFQGGFFLLSKSGSEWKIGASGPEADELGAPVPPENLERCPPTRERKLREENKRLGLPVEKGPLYCPSKDPSD